MDTVFNDRYLTRVILERVTDNSVPPSAAEPVAEPVAEPHPPTMSAADVCSGWRRIMNEMSAEQPARLWAKTRRYYQAFRALYIDPPRSWSEYSADEQRSYARTTKRWFHYSDIDLVTSLIKTVGIDAATRMIFRFTRSPMIASPTFAEMLRSAMLDEWPRMCAPDFAVIGDRVSERVLEPHRDGAASACPIETFRLVCANPERYDALSDPVCLRRSLATWYRASEDCDAAIRAQVLAQLVETFAVDASEDDEDAVGPFSDHADSPDALTAGTIAGLLRLGDHDLPTRQLIGDLFEHLILSGRFRSAEQFGCDGDVTVTTCYSAPTLIDLVRDPKMRHVVACPDIIRVWVGGILEESILATDELGVDSAPEMHRRGSQRHAACRLVGRGLTTLWRAMRRVGSPRTYFDELIMLLNTLYTLAAEAAPDGTALSEEERAGKTSGKRIVELVRSCIEQRVETLSR